MTAGSRERRCHCGLDEEGADDGEEGGRRSIIEVDRIMKDLLVGRAICELEGVLSIVCKTWEVSMNAHRAIYYSLRALSQNTRARASDCEEGLTLYLSVRPSEVICYAI